MVFLSETIILISYVDQRTYKIVVRFKLQTTRAIKLMCVAYKSNQFMVPMFEGFDWWALFSRTFMDGPFE